MIAQMPQATQKYSHSAIVKPDVKVRVCLATPKYHPEFSGAAIRFMRYLPGLRQRGIDPIVFAGTPTEEWSAASGIEPAWKSIPIGTQLTPEEIDGVPVYRVRLSDSDTRQRYIQYIRALAKFCGNDQVQTGVVQHFLLHPFHIPWLIWMHRADIPMTYTYTMVEDMPKNPIRRLYRRRETKLRFDLMDYITVSSSIAQSAVNEFKTITPIEVIPNGVDLQRYRQRMGPEERNAFRKRHGIKSDDYLILTIGAVQPRKGIDLLVKAWSQLVKRLPQSHLMIIGPRLDVADQELVAFRREIEVAIAESNAPDQIHFMGHVNNVEEYLQIGDIFAFASRREGFGNVLLEAMATELPVVTTPFVGLPEEIGRPDQEYVLVERDVDRYSNVLTKLLLNPEERRRLGRNARAWVKHTMDLEKVLDQYAELYIRLARLNRMI